MLGGAELKNAHIESGVLFPSPATAGRLFYLTTQININTTPGLYLYDGTSWGRFQIVASKLVTNIVIVGSNSIAEGTVSNFSATATYNDSTTATNVTPVVWTADPGIGTITSGGVFTANTVNANTAGNITASYTYAGTTVTNTLSVTVTNIVATLSSIAIVGSSGVNEGTVSNYSATATFSDSSTAPNTAVIWNADPSIGTITSGGVFTAGLVTANTTGNITASYTVGGVTRTATKAVAVSNVATVQYPYYGVAPVSSTKNAALILSLPGRGTVADLTAAFTLTSTGSNTMFYAYPASYGLAKFEDQGAIGFFGGWDAATGDPFSGAAGPLTIQVPVDGVPTDYYLYQTDFPGLGTITWHVTH